MSQLVIFVDGCSQNIRESDIRDLFSHCGEVSTVVLQRGGKKRRGLRKAVVTFTSRDAVITSTLLDGAKLGDSTLEITPAVEASASPVQYVQSASSVMNNIVTSGQIKEQSFLDRLKEKARAFDEEHGITEKLAGAVESSKEALHNAGEKIASGVQAAKDTVTEKMPESNSAQRHDELSGPRDAPIVEKSEDAARNVDEKVSDTTQVVGDKVSDDAHNVSDKVSDTTHNAYERGKDSLHNAGEKVSDTAHNAYEKTKDTLNNAGEKISYGAGLAYEVGKDKLGNAVDKTKDTLHNTGEKVSDAAHNAYEKGRDTLHNVGEKISDSAQQASDKGKDVINNVGEKLSSGAHNAAETGKEATHSITEQISSGLHTVLESTKAAWRKLSGGEINEDLTVHIGGVSQHLAESDLREFFSHCGEVSSVRFREHPAPDGTREVFVTFATRDAVVISSLLSGVTIGDTTSSLEITPLVSEGHSPLAYLNSATAVINSYIALGLIRGEMFIQTLRDRAREFDERNGISKKGSELFESKKEENIGLGQKITSGLQTAGQKLASGARAVVDAGIGAWHSVTGSPADRKQELCINVAGCSENIDGQQLRDFFSHCGELTSVHLFDDPSEMFGSARFAVIEFKTRDAVLTSTLLSGVTIGDSTIDVTPVVAKSEGSPVTYLRSATSIIDSFVESGLIKGERAEQIKLQLREKARAFDDKIRNEETDETRRAAAGWDENLDVSNEGNINNQEMPVNEKIPSQTYSQSNEGRLNEWNANVSH